MRLKVTPIYGWGWPDGSDVPAPFEADLAQVDNRLSGTVLLGEYAGWQIGLSKRHAGNFDGYCNLLLTSEDRQVAGYAKIAADAVAL